MVDQEIITRRQQLQQSQQEIVERRKKLTEEINQLRAERRKTSNKAAYNSDIQSLKAEREALRVQERAIKFTEQKLGTSIPLGEENAVIQKTVSKGLQSRAVGVDRETRIALQQQKKEVRQQRQALEKEGFTVIESKRTALGKSPITITESKYNQLQEQAEQGNVVAQAKLKNVRAVTKTVSAQNQEPQSNYILSGDPNDKEFDQYGTPKKEGLFQGLLSSGAIGFPGSSYIFDINKKEEASSFLKGGVSNFVFSPNNPFLGVGIGGQAPTYTRQDISGYLQNLGTTGKVTDLILPKSVFQIALTGGVAGVLTKAPLIIRGGTALGFGGYGTSQALDPSKTKEERIAAGIVGGAGLLGAGLEFAPYIKGTAATLSSKYSGVVTEDIGSFKDINVIKSIGTKDLDIALIPEGSPLGSSVKAGTPAFVRGGFGFGKAEQQAFIGQPKSTVVSSQIGFLEGIKGETVALDRMLFGTPADISTGTAQTRISRLGLVDLFKAPGKNAEIGFLPSKPQLLVFENQKLGTNPYTGFKAGYAAKGAGTGELEVTTLSNIYSGGKVGVTKISGQAVNIYSASLKKTRSTPNLLKNIPGFDTSTLAGTEKIPGLSLVSPSTTSSLVTNQIDSKNTPTTQTKTTTKTVSVSTISKPTTKKTTSVNYPSYNLNSITSPPITTTIKTEISPPSPPQTRKTTTIIPPTYPSRPKYPQISLLPQTVIPPVQKIDFGFPVPTKKRRSFTVSVRRFGKFRPIGKFPTLSQAFDVGKKRVGGTLAATFKIEGNQLPGYAPKGFKTKYTNQGTLFIEQPKFRLSTTGEVKEIHKSKKKKKKGLSLF